MLAPITGKILLTQLYGSLRGGAAEAYTAVHNGVSYRCLGHPALDISCPVGTPIYAMKPGVVQFFGPAWDFPEDGYAAALGLHAVVTLAGGEQHWYAHLSQALVPSGAGVQGGQQIALSGASGNVTGPHLHVAVRPPTPSWGNGFDGFVEFLTHFDTAVYPQIDLSLV